MQVACGTVINTSGFCIEGGSVLIGTVVVVGGGVSNIGVVVVVGVAVGRGAVGVTDGLSLKVGLGMGLMNSGLSGADFLIFKAGLPGAGLLI